MKNIGEIRFDKLMADVDPHASVVFAHNVIPSLGRFIPFYGPADFSDTINDVVVPMYIFSLMKSDGAHNNFVCTDKKIYRESNRVLSDVTRTSGQYNSSLEINWDYTVYGNALYVTNYVDNIQVLFPFDTATNFADLTSAPKAKTIEMYKDFLFIGYTNDGATEYPRRLQRSVQGDPSNWGGESSGFYDLPSFGEHIVCIKSIGDYLAVYLNNSIYLVSFVGDPIWFAYDKVSIGTGPLSLHSVVRVDDNTHIFLGRDDVYVFSASEPRPIGAGIRQKFLPYINLQYKERITSLINRALKIIVWAYPSNNSTDGIPDKLLIYNYEENSFSTADCDVYCLNEIASPGFTIDDLDILSEDINNLPYPVDSNYYKGLGGAMGGVNKETMKIAVLYGRAKQSYIESGEMRTNEVITLTKIKPIVEKPRGEVQCKVKYRLNYNEDFKETPFKPLSDKGIIGMRVTARGMKFVLRVDGKHDGIYGLQYETASRGLRW